LEAIGAGEAPAKLATYLTGTALTGPPAGTPGMLPVKNLSRRARPLLRTKTVC